MLQNVKCLLLQYMVKFDLWIVFDHDLVFQNPSVLLCAL